MFLMYKSSNLEKRKPVQIITKKRSLLNQNMIRHQNKNYGRTLGPVEEACLEKYEFIKAPLAEQNETLMEETEATLREELRDQVDGEDADSVQTLVKKYIPKNPRRI
jgi:hypothetical protein